MVNAGGLLSWLCPPPRDEGAPGTGFTRVMPGAREAGRGNRLPGEQAPRAADRVPLRTRSGGRPSQAPACSTRLPVS